MQNSLHIKIWHFNVFCVFCTKTLKIIINSAMNYYYGLLHDLTVSHYHLFFCIVLVALQFPEGLLMFACTIADILERYSWLPSFCPQFLICFLNSWHQRKGSILAGWRFASNGETVKNLWSSQISLLDSFRTFRENTKNKVFFLDYLVTFVPVAQQVLFLFESRINFLHLELLPPLLQQFFVFH